MDNAQTGGQATATASPPKAPLLNPRFIIPFVNSVREVFATMARVETTVDRPVVKTNNNSIHDISGIIGFSGEVIGSVVLSFSREAAVALVEAFAGTRLNPDDPDFADAIGELANMVAGSAKKHLGAKANISVPSVVIGKDHRIARLSDVPCVVIPCHSAAGDFAVEVCIKQVMSAPNSQ